MYREWLATFTQPGAPILADLCRFGAKVGLLFETYISVCSFVFTFGNTPAKAFCGKRSGSGSSRVDSTSEGDANGGSGAESVTTKGKSSAKFNR